jgi:DNA polymerase III epsilon subunit-like protein
MLATIGFHDVHRGEPPASSGDVERLTADDVPSVGLALGVFKAAQLIEMGDDGESTAFANFTAVDLETTTNDIERAEIVEIAAVRVRDGQIVERFVSLVKPVGPITQGAIDAHGIRESDVASAPAFADVWPQFRAFCGDDVIVAHNGYQFDFKILARMSRTPGNRFDLCTYDTLPLARELYPTSRKLVDLARQFGISPGQSHRALDDTLTLVHVCLALDNAKRKRARTTALINLLDHLGVALALCEESELCAEALLFRHRITRVFSLGRYSSCLEWYEREHGGDLSIPVVDEVIDRLGGTAMMERIRAEKSADERYPAAMTRLRRLIAEIPPGTLDDQLSLFLERAALSKWDGLEPDHGRVNLLTLHSTKGLQFSRVYIVGVEDAQMPGGSPSKGATPHEIEEARRLLYVGMTRTVDRLTLTRAESRSGKPTGGHRFLDEMGVGIVHGVTPL